MQRLTRQVKFSTAASRKERNLIDKQIIEQKKAYEEQMSALRKRWASEFAEQKVVKEEIKKVETKKVVLAKAVKLRENRRLTALRKQEAEVRRQAAERRYKENLAKSQLEVLAKEESQLYRLSRAVSALNEESSNFVSEANLELKITPGLFEQPSSTGLTTKWSDMWRYEVMVPSLHRLRTDEYFQELWEERQEEYGEEVPSEASKKLKAVKFLNDMVGTAEERSKFEEMTQVIMEREGTPNPAVTEMQEKNREKLERKEFVKKIDQEILDLIDNGEKLDLLFDDKKTP